jgi:hypothetical protein
MLMDDCQVVFCFPFEKSIVLLSLELDGGNSH